MKSIEKTDSRKNLEKKSKFLKEKPINKNLNALDILYYNYMIRGIYNLFNKERYIKGEYR